MSTTAPRQVAVDIADIERIRDALLVLSGSASTEGCEKPYAVIDEGHLNSLKSAFLPLRKMLDDVAMIERIRDAVAMQERDAAELAAAKTPVGEDPGKQVTVVVEAFETSQWGADGPDFMSLCVTREFLSELQDRVMAMSSAGVESINLSRYPEDWGPGNIDLELRLQDSTLVVTANGDIWFEDRPKHSDYLIQSRSASIEDLQKMFEASEHMGTQFISSSGYDGSIGELAARYWEDECEKALCSLPSGEEPDPASTTPEQLRYARALAAVEALDTDSDEDEPVPAQ